jgi:hypothetical protein
MPDEVAIRDAVGRLDVDLGLLDVERISGARQQDRHPSADRHRAELPPGEGRKAHVVGQVLFEMFVAHAQFSFYLRAAPMLERCPNRWVLDRFE